MANEDISQNSSTKSNDLRNRILFTIFILCIYRLGTFVPLAGIYRTPYKKQWLRLKKDF